MSILHLDIQRFIIARSFYYIECTVQLIVYLDSYHKVISFLNVKLIFMCPQYLSSRTQLNNIPTNFYLNIRYRFLCQNEFAYFCTITRLKYHKSTTRMFGYMHGQLYIECELKTQPSNLIYSSCPNKESILSFFKINIDLVIDI